MNPMVSSIIKSSILQKPRLEISFKETTQGNRKQASKSNKINKIATK